MMASCPNIKIRVKQKKQMSHVLAVIAVCLIAGGGGIAIIAMVTHFSINEDSKEVGGTQSLITTPNIITSSEPTLAVKEKNAVLSLLVESTQDFQSKLIEVMSEESNMQDQCYSGI